MGRTDVKPRFLPDLTDHRIRKGLAQLYVAARAANGGSEDWLNKIEDKGLIDTCHDFNIAINQDFVD